MKLDVARSLPRTASVLSLEMLTSFGRWWSEELRRLLSNRIGRWLLGPQRKSLELELARDKVQLALIDTEQRLAGLEIPAVEYARSTLDDFLKSHGTSRKDVDIIIRLPLDRFFCREMLLPKQALRSLDDIMQKDTARKTPFRMDEILHRHFVQRAGHAGKLLVWQWIIKRRYVDEMLARLQLTSDEVAFFRAADTSSTMPVPTIRLSSGTNQARAWYWTAAQVLLASAALLSLAAVSGKLWQQEAALNNLAIEIAATRPKAQKVRAQLDELERKNSALAQVRSEKAAMPGLIELWEQTTVTLPPHSWLTELQFSRGNSEKPDLQLSLTGYSESAAGLVRIFDGSPLFEDATLTSPITVDSIEAKERFSLRMKARSLPKEEVNAR